nr:MULTISPECIES: restriction endonuclease subunit S [Vagococcus]
MSRLSTHAWEQRELGSIAQIVDTKHATAPITDEKTNYLMIRTSTVRNGALFPNLMDHVTQLTYMKWSERIVLQPEDVVFTREAPMGESAVIPDDSNNYFLGQRVVAIRPTKELNANYLVANFLAPSFKKKITVRNSESTTVANFGIGSLNKHLIDLPTNEEQNQIGNFFKQLDDTIALHQRKV